MHYTCYRANYFIMISMNKSTVSKYNVAMTTLILSLPLSLPLSKLSNLAELFLDNKNVIIYKQ